MAVDVLLLVNAYYILLRLTAANEWGNYFQVRASEELLLHVHIGD
jgi:hypothetical protein